MQLVVPKSATGERLDIFLSKNLPHLSRSLINKFIKSGQISSTTKIKPSSILKGNEIFLINADQKSPSTIEPIAMDLDIIYSDEHIAIINKPQGLVVHPGAGVKKPTLCHGLLYHFPDMFVGNAQRPGLVHRLDKDTQGLMVIAKTQSAHMSLSLAFKNRQVVKIYRTLCFGHVKKDEFELLTGHMRHPHNRLRFLTNIPAPKIDAKHVRMAHTKFKVVERMPGITMLLATLYTGRTHQIRAHLADIGHPIVGDKLYGGNKPFSDRLPIEIKNSLSQLKGQALFAEVLEFDHPITKQKMSFTANTVALIHSIYYGINT